MGRISAGTFVEPDIRLADAAEASKQIIVVETSNLAICRLPARRAQKTNSTIAPLGDGSVGSSLEILEGFAQTGLGRDYTEAIDFLTIAAKFLLEEDFRYLSDVGLKCTEANQSFGYRFAQRYLPKDEGSKLMRSQSKNNVSQVFAQVSALLGGRDLNQVDAQCLVWNVLVDKAQSIKHLNERLAPTKKKHLEFEKSMANQLIIDIQNSMYSLDSLARRRKLLVNGSIPPVRADGNATAA